MLLICPGTQQKQTVCGGIWRHLRPQSIVGCSMQRWDLEIIARYRETMLPNVPRLETSENRDSRASDTLELPDYC